MAVDSVILAAGLGTRMRSDIPKVLHTLGERTMLAWSIAACQEATGQPPLVVLGPDADQARHAAGAECTFVIQAERLGTGHATLQAEPQLRAHKGPVLVTNADMPLIKVETMAQVIRAQEEAQAPFSLLVHRGEDSRGFGRLVRDPSGKPMAVVEEAHLTEDQKSIREFNAGLYCVSAVWLWTHLPRLPLSSKGEYYLTDLVAAAYAEGALLPVVVTEDADEVIGINTRQHLAEAEAALRRRINRHWMLEGVTLIDPLATYIGPQVRLGGDSTVHPNTHLRGATVVGRGCELGPNTIITDSHIGDKCRVLSSVVDGAVLEDEVSIGPFARLRSGAHLMHGVHMGNFGEVKNSTLGPGVKMGHFSYIGDSEVGEGANIGAGTITCNFGRDGRKQRTEIGAGAFIGSDTMLVAPVRVGIGAATAAGSVVTKDVPDHCLAVGAPARVIRKLKDSNE
jgi:bifunctional UDP-N-acetylglucosamine pyrophosphorylase/glucosamine-1-phosphate N-acetyltransferase